MFEGMKSLTIHRIEYFFMVSVDIIRVGMSL
jgi:hypothetical protein